MHHYSNKQLRRIARSEVEDRLRLNGRNPDTVSAGDAWEVLAGIAVSRPDKRISRWYQKVKPDDVQAFIDEWNGKTQAQA